jgi:hypothetical protein
MSVKCEKCGEELLGAVNRCWKCGQPIARMQIQEQPSAPTASPPHVEQPLDAQILEETAPAGLPVAPLSPLPASTSPFAPVTYAKTPKPSLTTADRIDALRSSQMAMGGTVASLILGLFALVLASFRFEAALIALLGLFLGIWGLKSQRRNLALAAMLLCCLGIGLGSYTGAYQLYVHVMKNRVQEDSSSWPP